MLLVIIHARQRVSEAKQVVNSPPSGDCGYSQFQLQQKARQRDTRSDVTSTLAVRLVKLMC